MEKSECVCVIVLAKYEKRAQKIWEYREVNEGREFAGGDKHVTPDTWIP